MAGKNQLQNSPGHMSNSENGHLKQQNIYNAQKMANLSQFKKKRNETHQKIVLQTSTGIGGSAWGMGKQSDGFHPPQMNLGFGPHVQKEFQADNASYFPSIEGGTTGSMQSSYNTFMTKPNPYNTSLKATVMRRACVALKPFDQVRFSNKIGSPATQT